MTEQTAGPKRMRQWADYIEKNIRHHLLPLAVKNPDALRELAAQWEADLKIANFQTDEAAIWHRRAKDNEFEATTERLRAASADAALAEAQHNAAFAVGQNERLIKAAGAENVDGAIAAIEAQRAALEQARALLREYQNGEPQDATWRHDYGAKLAALLAAAPGGEARP